MSTDTYFTSRRFHDISDATSFDQGDEFGTEAEVREYFTVANMAAMFGADAGLSQAELDGMANAVIANRWHCEF